MVYEKSMSTCRLDRDNALTESSQCKLALPTTEIVLSGIMVEHSGVSELVVLWETIQLSESAISYASCCFLSLENNEVSILIKGNIMVTNPMSSIESLCTHIEGKK